MTANGASNSPVWEVPYLPIDPEDIGRTYEAVIRINSQSGKGGVAYIMQEEFHLDLPRPLQVEFSRIVQSATDESGLEISSREIWELFEKEYLGCNGRFDLVEHRMAPDTHASDRIVVSGTLLVDGETRIVTGDGNGPIDAYTSALARDLGVEVNVLDYKEHATGARRERDRRRLRRGRAGGRRLPVRSGNGPQHRDGLAQGGDERGEPPGALRG